MFRISTKRRKKITYEYPNSCVACSLFNVSDPFFETVIGIKDECRQEYENPLYEPFTKISVNGQFEKQFNQTRCCEGFQTLIYKIDTTTDPSTSVVKENTSSNDTTILPSSTPFQSIDTALLITVGIVGVIGLVLFVIILLCAIVVKSKRLENKPRKELRFRYGTAVDVKRQSDRVYTQLDVPLEGTDPTEYVEPEGTDSATEYIEPEGVDSAYEYVEPEGTDPVTKYVEPITQTRSKNQRHSITCTNETPQYCEVIA